MCDVCGHTFVWTLAVVVIVVVVVAAVVVVVVVVDSAGWSDVWPSPWTRPASSL